MWRATSVHGMVSGKKALETDRDGVWWHRLAGKRTTRQPRTPLDSTSSLGFLPAEATQHPTFFSTEFEGLVLHVSHLLERRAVSSDPLLQLVFGPVAAGDQEISPRLHQLLNPRCI